MMICLIKQDLEGQGQGGGVVDPFLEMVVAGLGTLLEGWMALQGKEVVSGMR